MTRKAGRETMKKANESREWCYLTKKVPKNIPVVLIWQQSSRGITAFSISAGTACYLFTWKGELDPRIKQNQRRFSVSASSDRRGRGRGAGGRCAASPRARPGPAAGLAPPPPPGPRGHCAQAGAMGASGAGGFSSVAGFQEVSPRSRAGLRFSCGDLAAPEIKDLATAAAVGVRGGVLNRASGGRGSRRLKSSARSPRRSS